MINPAALLASLVTALQSMPEVVAEVKKAEYIYPFIESFPEHGNLRLAIVQMVPASLMVAWQGSTPVQRVGYGMWVHRFSLYLKPGESYKDDPQAGPYRLWEAIVNGIPAGQDLPLINYQVHSGCYPLDVPSIQRQTMLLTAEGATLDYWEVTTSLSEIGD